MREIMASPASDDERIDPKNHPKYKQIREEVERRKASAQYEYFNDDYSLLRVGPNHLPEQFAPKSMTWKPGGIPSYRAARLNYEQARKLAYRLVNTFGDPDKLKDLDIGSESWPDEPDEKDSK
jgi:hypothetical protein